MIIYIYIISKIYENKYLIESLHINLTKARSEIPI